MEHDQPDSNSNSNFLSELMARCRRGKGCARQTAQQGQPLAQSCCNGRLRVCAVKGDRRTCARMAHLGLMPGCELELLCKGSGEQCMVKVNGGTISLDAPTAANILVAPL